MEGGILFWADWRDIRAGRNGEQNNGACSQLSSGLGNGAQYLARPFGILGVTDVRNGHRLFAGPARGARQLRRYVRAGDRLAVGSVPPDCLNDESHRNQNERTAKRCYSGAQELGASRERAEPARGHLVAASASR